MIINQIRYCGGCRLCCTIQEVSEIKKPEGITCSHCSIEDGCTIYETRPESCKEFHCLWQLGLIQDKRNELRPDKLGIICLAKEEIEGYSPIIQLNSLKQENFKKKIVKRLIENWLNAGFNIACVALDKKDSELILA